MGNNKKKTSPKKSRRSQLQKIKDAIFQEPLRTPLLFLTTGIFLLSIFYFVTFEPHQQEICFQVFKNKLLEPGLVDHIIVSNRYVANIYVRNYPKNQTTLLPAASADAAAANVSHSRYNKYYFNIGSVDSFERNLEKAQNALGIDHHDFVPVTYTFETDWYQEFLTFFPILLPVGFLLFMLFDKGGIRGIFNIRKAHLTKLDKHSKNKVGWFMVMVATNLLIHSSLVFRCVQLY
jgi:AFG3 family protein